jgi:Putative zinc-finger
MADSFTNLLSDYLDDEDLPIDERRRIEAHLAGCSDCRAMLADLSDVAARAARLPDTSPEADLWPGIAARIDASAARAVTPFRAARPAARRISFTVPQLVAAGLALMLLSGGTVWLARHGGSRTDFEPVSAQFDPSRGAIRDARAADLEIDDAVADLERTLDAGRARLAPETVRVLETNLQAIDRAIQECRTALADDPSSVYLNTHLANAQRRKLTLLRHAAALVAAQS